MQWWRTLADYQTNFDSVTMLALKYLDTPVIGVQKYVSLEKSIAENNYSLSLSKKKVSISDSEYWEA